MSKILDLDVFEEKTLDVRANGIIIKIMKPTEFVFLKMLAYQNFADKEDISVDEALKALNDVLYIIMNNNANQTKVTVEDIESIPFENKIKLMTAYSEFIQEITENPN